MIVLLLCLIVTLAVAARQKRGDRLVMGCLVFCVCLVVLLAFSASL